MSRKDDDLNWPAAFLIVSLLFLAVIVSMGEEFWLKVLG